MAREGQKKQLHDGEPKEGKGKITGVGALVLPNEGGLCESTAISQGGRNDLEKGGSGELTNAGLKPSEG